MGWTEVLINAPGGWDNTFEMEDEPNGGTPGGISNNRNSIASQGSLFKKKNCNSERSVEKYIPVMVRIFFRKL